MKLEKQRTTKLMFAFVLMVNLFHAVPALPSDGVLPLRLPSDGALPLRLNGDAIPMSTPNGVRVPTNVTLTGVTQESMPATEAIRLACQADGANASKHAAQGSVAIAGQTFGVRGICYNAATRNMEIVAERRANNQSEQASMTATLNENLPRALSGRLVVKDGSAVAKRFAYQLSAQ